MTVFDLSPAVVTSFSGSHCLKELIHFPADKKQASHKLFLFDSKSLVFIKRFREVVYLREAQLVEVEAMLTDDKTNHEMDFVNRGNGPGHELQR